VARFQLDHPTREGVHAEYGFDAVVGFFVDVFREGSDKPIASYDSFHPLFNRARPLIGALDFLACEGFFDAEDLEDAITALHEPVDVPDELREIADVIMNFKAAAD
jgi:hypothetical protein